MGMISAGIYTLMAAVCVGLALVGFRLSAQQRNVRDRYILGAAVLGLIFSSAVWSLMALAHALGVA